MRESRDEMIELNVHCHAETGKAMLLSEDGEEGNAEWVPKSQMGKVDVSRDVDGVVEIKEWLVEKLGWSTVPW